MPDLHDAGLLGLFLASFLAATLLPLGSEGVLALMAQGAWSTAVLLVVASAGNTLGGMFNYALGRWVGPDRLARWTRMDPQRSVRWKSAVDRHGAWCALLCWLPVVGDPLALALGLFGARPVPVLLLMAAGKVARYAALLAVLR